MLRSASGSGRIILAEEPPFRLGALWVEPAFRQVSGPDSQVTLEPRVMQVLVALAQADGGIVGRDALIERCWDGRIVGENAINRVISLLRHLAADTQAFEIETITKVGYRLNVTGSVPPEGTSPTAESPTDGPRRAIARRTVLGAIGAAAIAGPAYLLWSTRLSPERRAANRYYRAGIEANRRGDSSIKQAVAYYEQAVRADPDHAQAWGALARALISLSGQTYDEQLDPIIARAKAAAARSLALDPRNPDALTARVLAEPSFRNWAAAETLARDTLALRPELNIVRLNLALVLANTGRFREALEVMREVVAREPLVPDHQTRMAVLLWQTGRPTDARGVFDRAFAIWPDHIWVWTSRMMFLSLNGARAEALAMTQRDLIRGAKIGPLPPDVATLCADALAPGADGQLQARAVDAIKRARRTGDIASFVSIPYLAAMGDTDAAFDQAYGYYFGQRDALTGERQPLVRHSERWTDILFVSATAPMRGDPRFPRLTAAIGLDDYWRSTGTRPDYRVV